MTMFVVASEAEPLQVGEAVAERAPSAGPPRRLSVGSVESTVIVRVAAMETAPAPSTERKARLWGPSDSAGSGVHDHVALALPQLVHVTPAVPYVVPPSRLASTRATTPSESDVPPP